MDTLRDSFGRFGAASDIDDLDYEDEDVGLDLPPASIGQDERRMQVRAYNHWASLLEDRAYPPVEALEPDTLPDFGPFSVLLDFSAGIEDPAIRYLGQKLAEESDAGIKIKKLSDVPSRSLLSRITEHYMQILANYAPIGFEAEFINQRDVTILYRGILLPFSSDDDTIDYVYGVINWKEGADPGLTADLMRELNRSLKETAADKANKSALAFDSGENLTDWADGPSSDITPDIVSDMAPDNVMPHPEFGQFALSQASAEDSASTEHDSVAALSDSVVPVDSRKEAASAEWTKPLTGLRQGAETSDLYDCLAGARDLALRATSCEDRSRKALYAAVGRAYDFSLFAAQSPQDYDELIAANGLTVQARAPMTPIVKLVFGADYDKSRLTEYACVLSHAHRIALAQGALAEFLENASGGLKGVVNEERRLRREDAGEVAPPQGALRAALAKKLRKLEGHSLDNLADEGPEFAVVMVRRDGAGGVEMLGEVDKDVALIERTARSLLK